MVLKDLKSTTIEEFQAAVSSLENSGLTKQQKKDIETILSFANTEVVNSNIALTQSNLMTEKALGLVYLEKLIHLPAHQSIN